MRKGGQSSDALTQASSVRKRDRLYELFSRGARDWLRHNKQVRESVKNNLPELIAGPDVLLHPEGRSIRVPVRVAEHARFRLREAASTTGAGQGAGEIDRFNPARYNVYFFYASDGENLTTDRQGATEALRTLAASLNYGGFIETRPASGISRPTEMATLFSDLQREDLPLGTARLSDPEDVWQTLRALFQQQAEPVPA